MYQPCQTSRLSPVEQLMPSVGHCTQKLELVAPVTLFQ